MTASDPGPDLAAWLDRLSAALPAADTVAMTDDERSLVLELARVAAHRGIRVAAPITTYLAGIEVAGMEPEARVARLRALVEALDGD